MIFSSKPKQLYQVTFKGNKENVSKFVKAINHTPLNIDKYKMRSGRDLGLNRSRFWLPVFLLEFVLDVDPVNREKREHAKLLFQECLNNLEMSSLKIELLDTESSDIRIQFCSVDYFRPYLKEIAEIFNLSATVRKIDRLGFK